MNGKTVSEKPLSAPKIKVKKGTIGPVANLEQHVDPEWWKNIFNAYYLKTDGDVVEDREITCAEVDLFTAALNMKKESAVLDLCCGQGRHSLELARRGIMKVDGMDRSHFLITRAKATAKKEGLCVKFREGDARKLPYRDQKYDYVMLMGNSFGYFENANDDMSVLNEVFRVLKPKGKILIDVSDGEHVTNNYEPRSWEWIDADYFVCRERSLSADKSRLISREVVTSAKKGVVVDQFYAERLYSKNSIMKLLVKAGFKQVQAHGNIETLSKRNQDLGMMARRIIVTACADKPFKERKAGLTVKNVTVLMGDPKLTDKVKPSGVFDSDDFQTIDRLKAALASLADYNFTYLASHKTMINDLMKQNGSKDLIFNLCDEGYDNDATKELHVPALLEILKVRYTGGGPQCLAYCYDKSLVRGVAAEMGIPVPGAFFVKPEDMKFELPVNISFPLIVKPNYGDSSFGITRNSVVNNLEELDRAISEIRGKFGYEKPVLVEEFLPGKDITVGIIGNPPESYKILTIAEEDYSNLPEGLPRICGYEAKWDPESPYWKSLRTVAANLPDNTEKAVEEWCLKLFERLECRDYARIDMRLSADGVPKLLEVNPNPGWCWDGHLAKMAAMDGITYPEMLGMIIKAAALRYRIEEERKEGR